MSAINLLLGDRTPKADKALIAEQYQKSYLDSLDDCLHRAEGLAGFLLQATVLSEQANTDLNRQYLIQTADALQSEIAAAKIIFNDFYSEARLLSGHVESEL